MNEAPAKPWKATLQKVLTRNPWFSVLHQEVIFPDGSRHPYYTIDFPTPAVGIVVRRGDEYLLLRQYRFIVDAFVWAIPSGGVHAGERLEEAAARELREETGFRASSLRHLMWFYASYGCGNQRFEIFLAEDPLPTGEPFDSNEVMGLRWFSRDEIRQLLRDNGIVDGLSLPPLLRLLMQDGAG
jgi:8-oxo-dGTP pyrophosphatase MutT (NUDIX family)